MTVEEYLRSLTPGLDLQDNVVARAARSPKDVGLDPLPLDEDIDYIVDDQTGEKTPRVDTDGEYQKRLDYASSTVYYSVLGVFAGGGRSEEVGDVRVSRGGYTITMADRARFKAMGDTLRRKWGFAEEDEESTSEMYDASSLRYGAY